MCAAVTRQDAALSGARAGLAQASDERSDLAVKLKWTQNKMAVDVADLQQRLAASQLDCTRATARAAEVTLSHVMVFTVTPCPPRRHRHVVTQFTSGARRGRTDPRGQQGAGGGPAGSACTAALTCRGSCTPPRPARACALWRRRRQRCVIREHVFRMPLCGTLHVAMRAVSHAAFVCGTRRRAWRVTASASARMSP